MKKPEMTRDEKIALVRRTKAKYFSLRGKTPQELHMMEALIAACDVLELNETDRLESYKKGFLEGRIYEAKEAKAAQGDTEIVGEESGMVHAYWIPRGSHPSGSLECSHCGEFENIDRFYCPNCGAKMDGQRAGEEKHGTD